MLRPCSMFRVVVSGSRYARAWRQDIRSFVWLVGLAAYVLETAGLGILVPAYFGPGAQWSALNRAAERVPLIAIMNPNNGPGAVKNNNYAGAINALKGSKGRVIGYVHTSYTKRAAEEVRRDIDRYYSFYDIDGIFIDEMTNDAKA